MKVEFRVYGIPRPQGSKRAFVIRKGGKPTDRAVTVESGGDGLKTWRRQVAEAVRENRPATPLDGPLELKVTFYLVRPKSPRWPYPAYHTGPDDSKLVRALEDELTGIAIVDDGLICRIDAWKKWATDREPPGARVVVRELA